MVFALAACSQGSNKPNGKYVIDSVEASGISMSLDSMGITEDQRNSVYIQFNSDGTGKLCAMGEEEEVYEKMGPTVPTPSAPPKSVAGLRPGSPAGAMRPPPAPAPPGPLPGHKPRSSLSNLGRFAGGVAGRRKDKK